MALVTFLLAAVAACAGADNVMLDASAFESKASTPRVFAGINQTCYRLCQLDQLPASEGKQGANLVNPINSTSTNPRQPSTYRRQWRSCGSFTFRSQQFRKCQQE